MTARQTATIVALATALWEPAGLAQHDGQEVPPPVLAPGEEIAYVCPIHSDYTSEVPGTCPRDGMALVRANPYAVRDYRLEFETVPAVVSVGEPTTLRFRIFHPETGERISNFLTVHDKQYHLFVVSQDMAHFEHIHPEQEADGAWSIEVTLPRAGYYTVLSDFVPNGGSLQFIARTLVTAGYEGDLAADSARLTADEASTQSIGNLTATLSYDPAPFVAGLYGHLNFHLTDRLTGRPVTDLQPYLAAFGHTLVLSEGHAGFRARPPHRLDGRPGRRWRTATVHAAHRCRPGNASWRAGRHLRRTHAEARSLSCLHAVPARRPAAHLPVHLQRGGLPVRCWSKTDHLLVAAMVRS